MSWPCTTELALQARPDEFGDVGRQFRTTDIDGDDAAQAVIDVGTAGWEGFSGELAIGFGNLVEATGRSMRSVAVAASEAERACQRANRTLDALEIESTALLVTAQTQAAELDALFDETAEWERKRYWRDQAVQHASATQDDDPVGYETARRRRRDADVALYWLGAAADTKRSELAASQATFDRIREDEDMAQTDLGAALDGVQETLTASELEFSPGDLRGVEAVLDVFEQASLSMSISGVARHVLLNARNALADLVGIDTRARDARLELELLGPEGFEEALRTAVSENDLAEMERLAHLLANGLPTMDATSARRFQDLMEDIAGEMDTFARGFRHVFLFFLSADAPVPDWVLQIVVDSEGSLAYFGIDDIAMRDRLARTFGIDPATEDVGETVLRRLYDRFVTQFGLDALDAAIGTGAHNPIASAVVLHHLTDDLQPVAIGILGNDAGDIQSVQRYLDMAGRVMDDDEFETFVAQIATAIADPAYVDHDTEVGDPLGNDMAGVARAIGRLLYEASRANEEMTFDAGPILRVIAGTAVSTAGTAAGGGPGGKAASLALSSLLAMWDGSAASTRPGDTIYEADTYAQQSMLAIAAIASAGGPAAERLGELAVEYPDPEAFLEHLDLARANADARRSGDPSAGAHEDNDIAQYVDEFVNEMNGRIVDVTSNDE